MDLDLHPPRVMAGKLFLITYIALASFQEVYFGHLFQKSDPIAVLGLMISATICVALVIGLVKRREFANWSLQANWREYTALNFSSVVSWLGFFLALRYIEPAIASIICFMLGPCFLVLTGRKEAERLDKALSAGLVFVTIGLFIVSLAGWGSLGKSNSLDVVFGFLWAVISAGGIVLNTVYSKKLSQNNVSENQILLIRFLALLILAFLLAPQGSIEQTVGDSGAWKLLVLSTLTFYLPVWILQKAITRERTLVISYGLALIPGVTFLLQTLDSRFVFSPASLVLIVLGTGFSLVGAWNKEKARA